MNHDHQINVALLETLEDRTLMSASFVEPTVDGNVNHWVNVSRAPLFGPGGPHLADIHQGDVGDCWFVASLAEVAFRDPNLIRKDIVQRPDRTYDVYFHVGDQIVDEHVDGMLPADSGGELEYAKLGPKSCTWVAIMEKALTYFRNQSISPAYDTISGGSGWEALTDLGGTVTEVLPNIANPSQLFSQVTTLVAQNRAVDFCTKPTGGPLVNDHVFSVIATKTAKNGQQWIEVRNPWGNNPNFKANTSQYGATNTGVMWVTASSVLPELDEIASAVV